MRGSEVGLLQTTLWQGSWPSVFYAVCRSMIVSFRQSLMSHHPADPMQSAIHDRHRKPNNLPEDWQYECCPSSVKRPWQLLVGEHVPARISRELNVDFLFKDTTRRSESCNLNVNVNIGNFNFWVANEMLENNTQCHVSNLQTKRSSKICKRCTSL